ncbi:hypothetical protein HDV02_004528 [Globomyces sp. JEL0801]|nr:hypothetical protein HDV02_004528 [Globomyces sp. JEL0801]
MSNLKTVEQSERLESNQPIGEFNTNLDQNENGLDKIVMPLIHGQHLTTTISETSLFEKVASEYPLTGAMDENANVNASEMNPATIETIQHLKGKANILGERLFSADNQDSDPTTDNTLRALNDSMEELVFVVRENNTNANDLNENADLNCQSLVVEGSPDKLDSVPTETTMNEAEHPNPGKQFKNHSFTRCCEILGIAVQRF